MHRVVQISMLLRNEKTIVDSNITGRTRKLPDVIQKRISSNRFVSMRVLGKELDVDDITDCLRKSQVYAVYNRN